MNTISGVERLLDRIRTKTAQVAVVGLGYVGLPQAMKFAEAGFTVHGIEDNAARVEMVRAGQDYINDDNDGLRVLVEQRKLLATSDRSMLSVADAVVICVPTPLTKNREPDVSYVTAVTKQVAGHLRKGQLVVLESTTFPGTTEEVMLPILLTSGLQVGKDFYVAYSPERIDPGNLRYHPGNTPKIVGGVTSDCARLAELLYRMVVGEVHVATSPRTAEMVKLHENIFRCVNIALVNELALLCHHMDIDVWEVVQLAATKPYGFMPFYPGPGLGGHCIPIDPFYLTWKAREYDFQTKFIELAGEINMMMPAYVVQMVIDALGTRHKSLRGSNVLVVGAAYKPNVADCRESPALRVMDLLERRGALVSYYDDLVPSLTVAGKKRKTVELPDVSGYDCTVIVTAHSHFDVARMVEDSQLVVDTRDATGMRGSQKIFVLGA